LGLVGLSVAVILHTAFDYGLVGTDPLVGIIVAVGVIVAGWVIFFRFARTALAVSPFRPEADVAQLSMATKYCIFCGALILADDRFCRSCGARQL